MEFKKIRPPPFEGTTNPDEVECWVEEMEKKFTMIKCNVKEKLKFGVYMLKEPTNN